MVIRAEILILAMIELFLFLKILIAMHIAIKESKVLPMILKNSVGRTKLLKVTSIKSVHKYNNPVRIIRFIHRIARYLIDFRSIAQKDIVDYSTVVIL